MPLATTPARLLRQSARAFLAVLAPRLCTLCSELMEESRGRFEFVCNSCADNLLPAPRPHEVYNQLAGRFAADDLALSRIAARYELSEQPPLADMFYALKYKGHARIGREFGRELGKTLRVLGFGACDALVPVPIHPARMRERGYNQAAMLAHGVAEVLHVPVWEKALKRRINTVSQTSMKAAERIRNVHGIFATGKQAAGLHGAHLLLIDDICTTGSTLNACATTLLELGALQVEAATLAFAR